MKLHEPPLEEHMTASFSLTHLTDEALLRELTSLVSRDRSTTAALVAHLAEVERRELHLPAGFPSLLDYCVHELKLSRDEALKRIRVARQARKYPIIFYALADGRLTLTTVLVLRRHLRHENARELLKAAMNKTKSEVLALLAARYPKSELLPLMDRIPIATITCDAAVAPEPLLSVQGAQPQTQPTVVASALQVDRRAPRPTAPAPRVEPIAEERFGLHVTIGRDTHDKLEYLRELLSHAVPSGDLAEVLDRALTLAITAVEKRKFGATSQLRNSKKPSGSGRYIPLPVRRAVLARDGHQCTFVGTKGRRCPARKLLEFHHDGKEFARGGEATVPNLCLRCKAHNQYAAEQSYGADFMQAKRAAARRGKRSDLPHARPTGTNAASPQDSA